MQPLIILSIRGMNSEADSGKKVKKKMKTYTSSTLSEAKAAEGKANSGGSPSHLAANKKAVVVIKRLQITSIEKVCRSL